jgi:hypothetical protein
MSALRIMDIWDMLKFNAPHVASAAYNLGIIAERFVIQSGEAEKKGDHTAYVGWRQHSTLIDSLEAIEALAISVGLPVTAASCGRLKEVTDRFQPYDGGGFLMPLNTTKQLGYMATSLSITLTDELATLTVVCVGSNAKAFLDDANPHFGQEVEDAFPSVAFDIGEASKCRALTRWTASVMHLMRVLEVGLGCLGQFAGVDPNENWNTVLNQIEAELKKVGKKTHSPEEEQFAAEAATHFRSIKNAWRNHAMHAREKYDEERAVAIYDSVRSFMRHLATRLSE